MAIFEYAGQLRSGSAISGTLEAESADAATAQLGSMGIVNASIAEQRRMQPVRALSREDVLFFNQQLASLAQTGIALDKGLRMLAKDLQSGHLQRVVNELADELERGVPLEDAVAKRKNVFPQLYAEILRSGVKNNQLGSTLCNLNTHLGLMQETRRLFWEAAMYPIIVAVLGLGVLTIFMTLVVPQYRELMTGFLGQEFWDNSWRRTSFQVSGATNVLFAAADVWPRILIGIGVVVGGSFSAFWAMGRFGVGRGLRESLLRLMPGFWGAYVASLLARFCQAAALSAEAGHNLPMALRLAAGATGHRGLIHDADTLGRRIESGAETLDACSDAGMIPAIVGYTAQVAGARGQLAPALADMAKGYDALARHRISMLRLLLAPIFVLILAFFFGFAVFGIFGPMFRLINAMT